MSDATNIKFSFANIQIISKKLESPLTLNNQIKGIYNFEIQFEMKVEPEFGFVMPYVTVQIKDINNPEPLATFIIACIFHVEEFNNVIKLNPNEVYHIPEELEKIIKPVAISTTRGIIFSELRGTFLQSAIMPVVYM